MGVDKAEMRLQGRTMLEIAVLKLSKIYPEVVVVGGARERVPHGVRVIGDLRPGCGPISGMAAALEDLGSGRAVFLPVDMPLIPGGLLQSMVAEWTERNDKICFPVVDGVAQPLVSQLAGEFRTAFADAVGRGEFRVRALLEQCGEVSSGLQRSVIDTSVERDAVWPGWIPDEATWKTRSMWFANLNTPADFAAAERLTQPVGF